VENCKGCPVKDKCNYIEYSTLCPCRMCLIKVMCNDVCDEHVDFQVKTQGRVPIFRLGKTKRA